ncbi:hypothetical protein L9F63_017821, partial [Diploptera punctata]
IAIYKISNKNGPMQKVDIYSFMYRLCKLQNPIPHITLVYCGIIESVCKK